MADPTFGQQRYVRKDKNEIDLKTTTHSTDGNYHMKARNDLKSSVKNDPTEFKSFKSTKPPDDET